MTHHIAPIPCNAVARAATLCAGLLVLAMSCLSATRLSAPADSGEAPARHLAAGSAGAALPLA